MIEIPEPPKERKDPPKRPKKPKGPPVPRTRITAIDLAMLRTFAIQIQGLANVLEVSEVEPQLVQGFTDPESVRKSADLVIQVLDKYRGVDEH